ncbi:MAG: S8 family serine peptidase, partial [Gammaproteobacteria bacterium]|nr:S8 family serine peptidase [Gammaproteobacteria bacterium]
LGLAALHGSATGAGIRIAIVDTGVDLAHPDLAGQFEAHENFVAAVSPGFAGDLHGTGVAGIIGAISGNGAGIVGVAPGARLLAYKGCWPVAPGTLEARCNSFSLALAINTALRAGADVINLSLTGPHDPLIEGLLEVAAARGVIVVAADHRAAGDDGESFPASMPSVIAVRARERGAPVEIPDNAVTMPGLEILSTVPHGAYDFLTGCSFSAAQVSGLAALARQLQPATTSAQLVAALRRVDADIAAGILALIPPS